METLHEIRKRYSSAKRVSEEIYQTLRSAMIDNVLQSGASLVEAELASQFDVSRAPVREALKRLEIEGFVTYEQKYGLRVKTFSFGAMRILKHWNTSILALF
jgi:DNA-binding GntR family transcriptional regulator